MYVPVIPPRPQSARRPSFRGAVPLATLVLTMLLSGPALAANNQQKSSVKQKAAPKAAPVKKPQQRVIRESELKELTDELVMLAVEDELLQSGAIDGHRIDVDVDDGIVTLSGLVDSILTQRVAVGLAERVRGVVAVVDETEVNTPWRSDDDIKKDVQAALKNDPVTKAQTVTIAVKEGEVTLSGKVPTYGEKKLCGEVAMGVRGAEEVTNNLEVEAAKRPTDEELKTEITELAKFDTLLDDVDLDISVKDGKVVINGDVVTSFQRSHADFLAWQAGATSVDSRGVHVDERHTNPELRTRRYLNVTDDQILDAVQRTFKHDPRVLSFDPKVKVKDGVVTLTGDVGHLTAKRWAERDARHVVGVRHVKNNLRVRWPDKAPSDERIADFTRASLKRDPYVARHEIMVDCQNAHVSLYGLVDTKFEKQHAEWIASRQAGVVHVNDYLSVRHKWVPKTDEQIEADLKDKLQYTFVEPNNQVRATVQDGVAFLEGTVDSWYMWQTAMDQAIAAGAREPHMDVEVRYGLPSGPQYYGPHLYVPR